MLVRQVALFLVLLGNIAVSPAGWAQLSVDCPPGDFKNAAEASDCKRALAELERTLYEYELKLATFAIDVTVSVDGTSYHTSHGTGLLVSLNRGWFITAKHVLLGDKVWDLNYLKRLDFSDFESAMEDLFSPENPLGRPGKATIKIRPFINQPEEALDAIVVAFDRSSDLVILQIANIDHLRNKSFATLKPTIFEVPRLASLTDCRPGMKIRALGYKGGTPNRSIELSNQATVSNCLLTPQSILIGGRYFRFPLYKADADFEAGMSGGPVYVDDPNERRPPVVGVVSGGVPSGDEDYYVPAAAVVSFLERFGFQFDR
jgi:Trypsin-like peptidase domain